MLAVQLNCNLYGFSYILGGPHLEYIYEIVFSKGRIISLKQ